MRVAGEALVPAKAGIGGQIPIAWVPCVGRAYLDSKIMYRRRN